MFPYVGKLSPKLVNVNHVAQILQRSGRRVSPRTATNVKQMLVLIFRFGVMNDLCAANPAALIRVSELIPEEERKNHPAISPDELPELMGCLAPQRCPAQGAEAAGLAAAHPHLRAQSGAAARRVEGDRFPPQALAHPCAPDEDAAGSSRAAFAPIARHTQGTEDPRREKPVRVPQHEPEQGRRSDCPGRSLRTASITSRAGQPQRQT